MALPWLIGAGVAAVAAVAAAALSDDSSSSDSYSDNEDAERRRAARERAERQREEKMEALDASFNERLELDRKKMTSQLQTMTKVDDLQESMVIIESVSELDMNPDGSYKDLLTRRIVQNKQTLDKFHSNVAFFEQLYNGYVSPKSEVVKVSETIDSLEKQIKKIDSFIKKLD